MLTFIFGRPGSGKTEYVINKIKESVNLGRRTYFLVPDQQTYISECMLADLPASSALCFEIVTFSRLCELVFGKYGGLTDTHISQAGKHLTMWLSIREIADELKEYKNVKADPAFCQLMLSTVDELRASSVTPELCSSLAEKCKDDDLQKKLTDIALIYENFNRNLEKRLGDSARAAEDRFSRLYSLLSENVFLEGCDFFVDSFTSFTSVEQDILKEIFKQADNSVITFEFDKSNAKAPHIESIAATAKVFSAFAKDRHLDFEEIYLDGNKRVKSAELSALENSLWNFSINKKNAPVILEDERGAIQTVACKNEYEETQFAALSILDAHKKGMRFSEIALVMRSGESRKGIISSVFEKLGIPYFISEKTDLTQTPAARFILSALRCVTYNFRLEDVMTLLKTGLCGVDEIDADTFESYCRAWNINGSLFTANIWSMNPDGYTIEKNDRTNRILADVNRVRSALIPPLVGLKQKLSEANGNALEACRALYSYLREVRLAESLSGIAEDELKAGGITEAGELIRVYDCIVSAITDICDILGEYTVNVEELSSAIEIMLKHTDIASVPSINDCVTVGSADMLRVENIKMAILLGLCEGEFPAAYNDSGILCESDKEELESIGLSLSSRENRVISDELYFVYRAMTKPSERLVLCTCVSHIGGGSLTPSSAYNRVRQIFPYIEEINFSLDTIKDILNGSSADETSDGDLIIDPLFVRQLFGDKITLSKSKISTFAECPYKYWCNYVLKIREQNISEISYSHSGTIIHYVLEKFLSKFVLDDGGLPEISDEDMINEVNRLVEEYLLGIECPLTPSVMFIFSRLRNLSIVMVKSVLEEFKCSKFKILAFEKNISEKEGALSPLVIKIGDEDDSPVVSLEGVIDRIDFYDNGESKYLRIVDYKTGQHKFDTKKIQDGNDLQLPAYLFTAAQDENSEKLFGGESEVYPASALFLSADESGGETKPTRSGFILSEDEILRATNEELDAKKLSRYSKADNIFKGSTAVSRDEIKGINDTLVGAISGVAQNIYSGVIPKTPSQEACRFCMFRSSCTSAEK